MPESNFNFANLEPDETAQPDSAAWTEPTTPPQVADSDELLTLQQEFIADKQDLFSLFLSGRDVAIKPGSAFKIVYDRPTTIYLDAKDWQKMLEGEFSEEEMIWSTFHEIGHFLDMLEDPEGTMSHFEYMRTKVKSRTAEMKRRWSDALAAKGEALPPHVTDKFVYIFLFQKLHHFYNSLDDIYVNNLVAMNNPARYSMVINGRGEYQGNQTVAVERLYSNHLFQISDYSSYPKSAQLSYGLLRRRMVPSDQTVLSAEVEAVYQTQLNIGGKNLTLEKFLNALLCPTSTRFNRHTPSYRHDFIRDRVEPIFWRFLEEDLASFPPPPLRQKNQEGDNSDDTPSEGTEGQAEDYFQYGDKVRDKATGQIGTIVNIGADGEVTVEFNTDDTSMATELVGNNRKLYHQPNTELILIKKKSHAGTPSNQPLDPNAPEVEYEDEDEDDDNQTTGDGDPEEGHESDEEEPEGKKSAPSNAAKPDQPPQEGGESTPTLDPWAEPGKDSPITEEAIRDFLASRQKYQAEKQAEADAAKNTLTPQEAQAEANLHYDAALCQEFGQLDGGRARQIAEEWQKYHEAIEPYIQLLSDVFEEIIKTINNQISLAWQTGFRSGRFDVGRFIQKYAPALVAGAETDDYTGLIDFDNLDTYLQQEFISRLTLMPNEINIHLILDNSGSMEGDKILQTKMLMVLIYESLKSFEARVNHLFRLKQPFRLGLEVQIFGRKTVLAKSLVSTGAEERGQMLAVLAYLTASGNCTRDAQSWENICHQVNDPDYLARIAKGQALDLSIEVTDGESQTADLTRENIEQYLGLVGTGSASGIRILADSELKKILAALGCDSGGLNTDNILSSQTYRDSTFYNIFKDSGRPVKQPADLPLVLSALLQEKFAQIQRNLTLHYEPFEGTEEF